MEEKAFSWKTDGVVYKIRNVPYEMLDAEGEEFVDLNVAVKMEMIRELMAAGEIPREVDFELIAELDLKLE